MRFSTEDIKWYNDFYKNIQSNCPFWYIFTYEELKKYLKINSRLLELGCGQAMLLQFLARNRLIAEENIFAIDQSNIAVNYAKSKLPKSRIEQGDIYNIEHKDNSFDFIIMAEIIEHLEYPMKALYEVNRVLKRGGKLFISFPNYYNLPWLCLRILAEKLNKPNWIVLQPIDKIYNISNIVNLCQSNGLIYRKSVGSNYFPPILYKLENPKIIRYLNSFQLSRFSFHPILIFEKK